MDARVADVVCRSITSIGDSSSDRFRVDIAKGLIDVCVGTVVSKHILYINVVLPAPLDPSRSKVRPGVSFALPAYVFVDVVVFSRARRERKKRTAAET